MDQADKEQRIFSPQEVALKLKSDYSHGILDHTMKALDDICGLCWKMEESNCDAQDLLTDVAGLIAKNFGIADVSIAVRDRTDRLYHYKAVTGVAKETADGLMGIVYTKEQVCDDQTYPGHDISSHTKIYLSEEHPYAANEESSFRHPGLIGMRRRAINDCLEADYLDFYFYGPDHDILGWIETSGTRLRKLPDAATIRWIELIAFIVGQALQSRK